METKIHKFCFPDRTSQSHPWGFRPQAHFIMQRLPHGQIIGWLKIKQLKIIVFISWFLQIAVDLFFIHFYLFLSVFFLLVIQGWNVFMTSYWPQVCIEHYLNIEQCGWRVPDRNDWFEAVFSDTFKWIFRITRNSKLNLHKLLARAVVHLGEWYPI